MSKRPSARSLPIPCPLPLHVPLWFLSSLPILCRSSSSKKTTLCNKFCREYPTPNMKVTAIAAGAAALALPVLASRDCTKCVSVPFQLQPPAPPHSFYPSLTYLAESQSMSLTATRHSVPLWRRSLPSRGRYICQIPVRTMRA